jgi:DNA-binding transcriptional ArsR family regulator
VPDDVERDSGPITTDDRLRTLADPTRRRILDLLADLGTQTVGELAAHFPNLVASGISKHLMALRAKGLATATRQGRNQLYAIDADALSQVLAPRLARYESYWAGALTRLREVAEKPQDGGDGSA